MANQWGGNLLAPNQSAAWYFVGPSPTPVGPGPLPVLQVRPVSPSGTPGHWSFTTGGYPVVNQLGISTIWSQISPDFQHMVYFLVVTNNSDVPLTFLWLEAVL
jgi:hypothetical protein